LDYLEETLEFREIVVPLILRILYHFNHFVTRHRLVFGRFVTYHSGYSRL